MLNTLVRVKPTTRIIALRGTTYSGAVNIHEITLKEDMVLEINDCIRILAKTYYGDVGCGYYIANDDYEIVNDNHISGIDTLIRGGSHWVMKSNAIKHTVYDSGLNSNKKILVRTSELCPSRIIVESRIRFHSSDSVTTNVSFQNRDIPLELLLNNYEPNTKQGKFGDVFYIKNIKNNLCVSHFIFGGVKVYKLLPDQEDMFSVNKALYYLLGIDELPKGTGIYYFDTDLKREVKVDLPTLIKEPNLAQIYTEIYQTMVNSKSTDSLFIFDASGTQRNMLRRSLSAMGITSKILRIGTNNEYAIVTDTNAMSLMLLTHDVNLISSHTQSDILHNSFNIGYVVNVENSRLLTINSDGLIEYNSDMPFLWINNELTYNGKTYMGNSEHMVFCEKPETVANKRSVDDFNLLSKQGHTYNHKNGDLNYVVRNWHEFDENGAVSIKVKVNNNHVWDIEDFMADHTPRSPKPKNENGKIISFRHKNTWKFKIVEVEGAYLRYANSQYACLYSINEMFNIISNDLSILDDHDVVYWCVETNEYVIFDNFIDYVDIINMGKLLWAITNEYISNEDRDFVFYRIQTNGNNDAKTYNDVAREHNLIFKTILFSKSFIVAKTNDTSFALFDLLGTFVNKKVTKEVDNKFLELVVNSKHKRLTK